MQATRLILGLLFMFCTLTCCRRSSPEDHGLVDESKNQPLIFSLKKLNFDKYLASPTFTPVHSQVNGWDVFRYPTDELACTTGTSYFVMARRGLQTDKTVIWFDGGGACYPGRADCSKDAQFHGWIEQSGLASPVAENPLRMWNLIYLPYCDGSIHLGDGVADYDDDGIMDHQHWGFKMTSAAIRLVKELFPDSKQILLAGCSAGGSGTIGGIAVVRLAFPEARIYAVNLSGLGLVNPEIPEANEIIKSTWNLTQFIPADCPLCNEQLTYMYSWLLNRDPALKVAVFSSYRDSLPAAGLGMPSDDYQSLVLSVTNAIRQDHPDRFKRFFIAGAEHCLGDYTYQVAGISFWEWLGYLVQDDPRWIDLLE